MSLIFMTYFWFAIFWRRRISWRARRAGRCWGPRTAPRP